MKHQTLRALCLLLYTFMAAPCFAAENDSKALSLLADIRKIAVSVEQAGAEVNDFNDAVLKDALAVKFAAQGIAPAETNMPQFSISITALKIDDEKFAFCVQSRLLRFASIKEKPAMRFATAVWSSPLVLKTVAAADVNSAINQAAQSQADLFLGEHHKAVMTANTADPNEKTAAIRQQVTTPRQVQAGGNSGQFTASKNGKVFHEKGCMQAARINAANLIRFSSAEEATASGRRACKVCAP